MKKVKIMLTAVIVLAVVGGILAYKEKRIAPICTTATVNGTCPANRPCGTMVIGRCTPDGVAVCTTIPVTGSCANLFCPVFCRTIGD